MTSIHIKALCAVFSVVIATGLLGNIIIILVFMAAKSLRRPANVFIINLALNDILFMLSFTPFVSKALRQESWKITEHECLAMASCLFLASGSSVLCMGQLAVSRYIAIIRRNLLKYVNFYTTIPVAASSWLLTLPFYVAIVVGPVHVTYYPNMHGCMLDYSSDLRFTMCLLCVLFLPVNALILVIYWKLYREFRLTTARVTNHDHNGEADGRQGHSPKRRAEFLFALQMFLIFIFFNISLTPPTLAVTVYDTEGQKLSGTVWMFLEMLAIFNSAVTPFLYFIFHKPFRSNFSRLMGCVKSNESVGGHSTTQSAD